MAELEVHHETHESGGAARRIGVLAAVLAAILAVVTIAAHRAHTDAVIHQGEANDAWQHYQSTRVKYHNLELGKDLMTALDKPAQVAGYEAQQRRYEKQGEELQAGARRREAEARHSENQAQRYDLGEGFLEIGLVLTSLYYIARRMLFPLLGVTAAGAGIVLAVTGALLKL